MEQETITDERAQTPAFDPSQHGLWARFVDNGQVVHGSWVAAVQAGEFVGTCTSCGDYLRPQPAYVVNKHRTDYEARCRRLDEAHMVDGVRVVAGCGATLSAPGGRINRHAGRSRMV
jgi:hypothetical protein